MNQLSNSPQTKRRKVFTSASPLILLDIDVLLKICRILQDDGFLDLFFLIQVWFPFQTPQTITTLLNNLDWSRVHEVVEPFRNLECRVFNNFVKHTVNIGVKAALCYDSCKKLIRCKNPVHYLQILEKICKDDNLSFLAYYIFKTIYHPSTLQENALHLHQKLAVDSDFRSDFQNNCMTLKGRCRKYKRFWYGPPDIFPQNGVCSLNVSGGDHNMDPFGLGCSYKEIITTSCSECMILMINFKIFRGY